VLSTGHWLRAIGDNNTNDEKLFTAQIIGTAAAKDVLSFYRFNILYPIALVVKIVFGGLEISTPAHLYSVGNMGRAMHLPIGIGRIRSA
jgi:hypothetical protein